MKYVNLEQYGSRDFLKIDDMGIPQPGVSEVLIKVFACGVNRADLLQVEGRYPPPPGASPVLGLEVSGEIVAIGPGVSSFSVGDKVCALLTGGGYAEYCIADEFTCLPVPENISLEEAASLPEAYFTVWFNLYMRDSLKSDETLLVHGGASGIGAAAIQLAKAFGSTVICTAGNEEKCLFCRSLGADFYINYKKDKFLPKVLKYTQGRGVDVVLDIVGGSYIDKNIDLLAFDGRLIQIGFMRESIVKIDFRKIMVKGLSYKGSTLRARKSIEKKEIRDQVLKNVWPLFLNGRIKPKISKILEINKVKEALKVIESNENLGKVILII